MTTAKPARNVGRTKRHHESARRVSATESEKSWRPTDEDDSDGSVEDEQELDTDKYEGISPKAWT